MKIAIVTGATSGLGRAFLDEWQARDYYFDEVWLVARHQERLEEVGLNLPWDARLFALDLSVESDRAMLARTLKEEAPRVQYVVNAAGYGKIGSVEAIDATEQVGMVELNCAALVDVTQLVLPYLTLGSVIFEIASVAAFLPQPNFAVYAASKSFVHSTPSSSTRVLALSAYAQTQWQRHSLNVPVAHRSFSNNSFLKSRKKSHMQPLKRHSKVEM